MIKHYNTVVAVIFTEILYFNSDFTSLCVHFFSCLEVFSRSWIIYVLWVESHSPYDEQDVPPGCARYDLVTLKCRIHLRIFAKYIRRPKDWGCHHRELLWLVSPSIRFLPLIQVWIVGAAKETLRPPFSCHLQIFHHSSWPVHSLHVCRCGSSLSSHSPVTCESLSR